MLLHECFKPSLKEALSNQKNFSNSGVIILLDHSYCAWAVGNLLLKKKDKEEKGNCFRVRAHHKNIVCFISVDVHSDMAVCHF